VGERTRQSIEQQGLQVNYVPEKFTSASLAEYFNSVEVRSKRFLYPRGNRGNAGLIQYLSDLGAVVDPVIVYNNIEPEKNASDELYKRLVSSSIDVITFASPSAAINFLKAIPLKKVRQLKRPPKVAVIGPTTEEAVLKLGLTPDIVAKKSTVEGLVESIDAYYDKMM
jgi:uroporphyrinogen-III synthase